MKRLLLIGLLALGMAMPGAEALTNSQMLEHEEKIIERFMSEEKFSKVEEMLTADMKEEFSTKEFLNFKEQLYKNFGITQNKELFLVEKEPGKDLLRYNAVFSKVKEAQLSFMFNTEGKKPLLDDFALLLPPKPVVVNTEPKKNYKTTLGGIKVEVKEEEPAVLKEEPTEVKEEEPTVLKEEPAEVKEESPAADKAANEPVEVEAPVESTIPEEVLAVGNTPVQIRQRVEQAQQESTPKVEQDNKIPEEVLGVGRRSSERSSAAEESIVGAAEAKAMEVKDQRQPSRLGD